MGGALTRWADELLHPAPCTLHPATSTLHPPRWPDGKSSDEMAEELSRLNAPHLARTYDAPVITFSHFLPRPDLMPSRATLGGTGFLLDVAGKM